MQGLYYIPLLLLLVFSFSSCTIVPDEPEANNPVEEIGEEPPAGDDDLKEPPEDTGEEPPADDIDEDQPEEPQQELYLQLVTIAEDMAGIDLTNTVPVRGVQFTIEGVEIADVLTTSRSEDFMASFNEENGGIIIVSLAGGEIAPGEGLIAEVLFDGNGPARLSEIIIAE